MVNFSEFLQISIDLELPLQSPIANMITKLYRCLSGNFLKVFGKIRLVGKDEPVGNLGYLKTGVNQQMPYTKLRLLSFVWINFNKTNSKMPEISQNPH